MEGVERRTCRWEGVTGRREAAGVECRMSAALASYCRAYTCFLAAIAAAAAAAVSHAPLPVST